MFRPEIGSKTGAYLINAVLGVSVALFATAMLPTAHAEIFKCTDEFGNTAYLQTPCPVEKEQEVAASETPEPVADDVQVEDVVEVATEPQPTEAQAASSPESGKHLATCKKRYRDKIDEIDAEMRVSFSPAQSGVYKDRLKVLTRQLRACG